METSSIDILMYTPAMPMFLRSLTEALEDTDESAFPSGSSEEEQDKNLSGPRSDCRVHGGHGGRLPGCSALSIRVNGGPIDNKEEK